MTSLLLALLVSCYDGDTCRFQVDGKETKVRIYGIDAPELAGKGACPDLARASRDRLVSLLRGAKRIELELHGQDKYRRTLARVLADGQDVGMILVGEGHARRYDGGRRKPWC